MTYRVILFCALALVIALPAGAQTSTAEVMGTVMDSSGAAIPNAKVVVTATDTGFVREAVTDAAGNYMVTSIPAGTYTLAAEANGFRRLVQTGIALQVSQRARMDLKLDLGAVSESIEVTASAPLLESETSSLGSVISSQFVSDLPLNGRNFVMLATLSPGVSGTGFNTTGTINSGTRPDDRRPGSELFSNGSRDDANGFLYDGIDNNDRRNLSIVLRPGVEAIKEFKVQTNLYSVELGRNFGAVVDVITKSGGTSVHGSVFEFLRNSATDARSYFNTKGLPFAPYRYNQFGFSLGGPVYLPKLHLGKKTFFFMDYEGYRRTLLSTLTTTIPTLAMRTGDFGSTRVYDPLSTRQVAGTTSYTRDQFPNNQIPRSRWDPISATLVNAYPQPQTSAAINNYIANLASTQNWDQGDVRIDHQFSPSDTFFARWSIQNTSTAAPNTFPAVQLPGISSPIALGNEDSFAGTSSEPTQHAVGDYVHVFSPRWINDFRAGFNRYVVRYLPEGFEPGLNLGNKIGIPNSNTQPLQTMFPVIALTNYTGIGQSRSLPINRVENTFHYVDNGTYTRGNHTFKFGGDIRRRQVSDYQTNQGNGRFNFSPAFTGLPGTSGTGQSVASFLLGYPTLIQQDYLLAWTGLRGTEAGLYFGDDIRVNRQLTVNVGLRWEYYTPYSEVAGRIGSFDSNTGHIKVPGRDGVGSTAGVQRDLRDFSPRVGFAWQPAPKWVLRGGGGLFTNPNGSGNSALLRLHRHIPFGPQYSVSPGDIFVATRISDGLPPSPTVDFASINNPTGNVFGIFPNYKAAYSIQYNLTAEREITPIQLLIKAAYVGNLGRRIGTTFNLNQPVPGSTSTNSRRPYYGIDPGLGDVTYAVSDGLMNYQAFQLTVDKRMSHGLSVLMAYAWSHAIANVGNEAGGGTTTPQDPRYRNLDRSNANFDLRQRMTASFVYALPVHFRGRAMQMALGGWQVNGFVTAQAGLPFTPTLTTTTVNTGTSSRPDRAGNGNLPTDKRSVQRWFDPSAFTTPPPYTYGNAGRNILYGPGRFNVDGSLFKDFVLSENRLKLRFQAEAFNAFNHPQFDLPNASIGSAQAGVISSIVGNGRLFQFSLKLQF